jgi:hypothetical protein
MRRKRGCYRIPRHTVVQPLDQSIRLIPLTQGQNAIVDADDFEWLSQFNWFAMWSPDPKTFYAARCTRKNKVQTRFLMHREICKCNEGEECDHRNFNGLDNRKENLRPCTKTQNGRNRRTRADNTSGYVGVHKHKTRWVARISCEGNRKFIGGFSSAEDAARAYDKAAIIYHGEFAHLNFPL